jgi:hypothetical protein
VLRGQKKDRAPKLWSKKQNYLRKLRDKDRDRESRIQRKRNPLLTEETLYPPAVQ